MTAGQKATAAEAHRKAIQDFYNNNWLQPTLGEDGKPTGATHAEPKRAWRYAFGGLKGIGIDPLTAAKHAFEWSYTHSATKPGTFGRSPAERNRKARWFLGEMTRSGIKRNAAISLLKRYYGPGVVSQFQVRTGG